MATSIDATIAVLRGKPLTERMTVVDMECFSFGRSLAFIDHDGRHVARAEYRLHVQCAWRVIRGDRILVGYDDLMDPPLGVPREGFDPNSARDSARGALLRRFMAETPTQDRVVAGTATTQYGDATLTLRGGARIEILPAGVDPGREYWRLLLADGTHIVMSGRGLELVEPPPPGLPG